MAKYKLLGYGSVGEEVKTLQNALNATNSGYDLATGCCYTSASITGSP